MGDRREKISASQRRAGTRNCAIAFVCSGRGFFGGSGFERCYHAGREFECESDRCKPGKRGPGKRSAVIVIIIAGFGERIEFATLRAGECLPEPGHGKYTRAFETSASVAGSKQVKRNRITRLCRGRLR